MSNYNIDDAEELAELFKALANPHRLKIFFGLAQCCQPGQACAPSMRVCVGDLGDGLGLAPSTVSHHLKELRRSGLIKMKRTGRHVECWADPEALARLSEFFCFAEGDATALTALSDAKTSSPVILVENNDGRPTLK